MAINTLITLKDALTAWAVGHGQLQGRIFFEADDHREPIITESDSFPIMFVAPISVRIGRAMNVHTLRIYIYERINDDREDVLENANDTSLILRDIKVWWNDYGTDDITILDDIDAPFLCDKELDNLVGYFSDVQFEIPSHGRCAVPVNITPSPVPTCEPVEYLITDTDENELYSGSVASGDTLNQTIQDSNIELKNTENTSLGVSFFKAEATGQIIAPDAQLNVNRSDSTLISTEVIPSGKSEGFNVPDSQVNVNGVDKGDVVSVKTVDIVVNDGTNPVTPDNVTIVGNTVTVSVPPQVNRTTARIMKTNQTVSYRTGDDGDDERGRATSFLTLAENNIFGNTNRFTDRLGGQTYADNIVIDHSTYQHGTPSGTIIGWHKTVFASATGAWNEHIDRAVALSVGTFTSGWRLPNYMEWTSIWNFGTATTRLNYAPFNDATATNFWTSNTLLSDTTQAYYYLSGSGISSILAKTGAGSMRSMAVRVFTVTGTTLT